MTLAEGETVVCLAQSGGGYGEPVLREPERVLDDVEQGIVTPERARDVYRVSITDEGLLDESETSHLRRRPVGA